MLPALMCAQNSTSKIIPSEADFINSNIAGFGNDIGKITNRVTSMYELQSKFDEDSEEYKMLDYRICCGQLQQQDCIDRIKGVISKPMPQEWYDEFAVRRMEEGEKKELYSRIVASKKPYFMRYIYPAVSREYIAYIKKVNKNSLRRFDCGIDDLYFSDYEDNALKTEFVANYERHLILGTGKCVINKICQAFENRFDKAEDRRLDHEFDYTILKSGAEYTDAERRAIQNLYLEYNNNMRNHAVFQNYERDDSYEISVKVRQIVDFFLSECSKVCSNEDAMYDLIIDVAYRSEGGRGLVWSICGNQIIKNLMKRYGNVLRYPVLDENGDIEYCGERFSLHTIELEV